IETDGVDETKRLNPDRPWKARRDRFGRRHSPCRFWRVRLHFGSNREPTEPLRRLPWIGARDRRRRDQLHRRRRGGRRFSAGIRSLNQDARADCAPVGIRTRTLLEGRAPPIDSEPLDGGPVGYFESCRPTSTGPPKAQVPVCTVTTPTRRRSVKIRSYSFGSAIRPTCPSALYTMPTILSPSTTGTSPIRMDAWSDEVCSASTTRPGTIPTSSAWQNAPVGIRTRAPGSTGRDHRPLDHRGSGRRQSSRANYPFLSMRNPSDGEESAVPTAPR